MPIWSGRAVMKSKTNLVLCGADPRSAADALVGFLGSELN